jgi:hypothetical protein
MTTKKTPATKRAAKAAEPSKHSYRVAATRQDARSVAGHYPATQVQAFRVLAAKLDKDVQQLLAEGINYLFERYGVRERIPIVSGRRTKQTAAE